MKRRRTRALLAGAVATVAIAGACAPRFESGAQAQMRTTGAYPVLDWPAAVEDDADQEVAAYRIEVGGDVPAAVIATIAAPATECAVVGMPTYRNVVFTITAVDTAGESSAGRDDGRLTQSLATNLDGGTGTRLGCVPTTDRDGDRLPDAVETGDGVFRDRSRTGTSPTSVDTDGDALADGDEVLGTTAGLDLPAMGTTPTKRDVLIEYDWIDDATECGTHSHRPTAAALQQVTDMYGAAPLANPDGTTGIRVIHDWGQGGAFKGGTSVPDADGVIEGQVGGDAYTAIKQQRFAARRNGYFHYVLLAHEFTGSPGAWGQAEIYGDDMLLSLHCEAGDRDLALTVAHELGHNLGLRHGGDDNANNKPNYSSIMNYRYAFDGVDTNCDTVGDGPLAFSPGTLRTVDEEAVDELHGNCGWAFDWNQDGSISWTPYPQDLNGDGYLGVLRDHDDWTRVATGIHAISFDTDLSSRTGARPEVVTEGSFPEDG